ncbi:hypothetical protein F0562_007879 [Nyssa sinensis]|uniref:Uncharacterized protein n=1 Tax=Nyssa sinensis TaxID=561372 RepID=A0A5J5A9P1_9ASTE|nr:hypothetical protein F0562_007879 [Nyssa sinensis]
MLIGSTQPAHNLHLFQARRASFKGRGSPLNPLTRVPSVRAQAVKQVTSTELTRVHLSNLEKLLQKQDLPNPRDPQPVHKDNNNGSPENKGKGLLEILNLPRIWPEMKAAEEMSPRNLNRLQRLLSKSAEYSPRNNLGSQWREYHGSNDWSGLLDPLDENLRREVVRYGEFIQAAYHCFHSNPATSSEEAPSPRYVALPDRAYRVTKSLYATSSVGLPKWVDDVAPDLGWMTQRSSWVGYVAVCDDRREIARMGRRDIVIALRGTATCLEWAENVRDLLVQISGENDSTHTQPKVECGFLSLYKTRGAHVPSLAESVVEEVRRLIDQYKGETLSITVTGHSLGAALALLVADELSTCAPEAPPVAVFSFGGPRVGNQGFVNRNECQKCEGNQKKSEGQVEYRNFIFDQEVARRELSTMVILHEYPLSIVDHFGFRRYSNSLQPMFKMISMNTLKSDILKIYECEKSKTIKLLENVESRIALTSDMWTSNQTKKGFMAVTTHFIDDAWVLQSRILRFIHVPAPHNKEVLSDALVNCLLDWNIDRKLSTITLDNCTTNDAVIDNIGSKLDSSSLLLDGRVLHMRCCAHILNLIMKDGLEVIGQGIERICDSVVFWTATKGRNEKFEDTCRRLKVPHTKKLCLDCKTRWNSTYSMLETDIMYKDVFPRLKQRERLYTRLPTDEDWDKAKEICEKLRLFYSVTELFSGTHYPTANCYFPKVCKIRVALVDWLQSPIVLDPRYKLRLVSYYFEKIYGKGAQFEVEKIRRDCYDLLYEYKTKSRAIDTSVGGETSYFHLGASNLSKDDLSDYDLYVSSDSSDVNVKSKLVSPHRSRPHPITLEALMCSQSWLWNEINGSLKQEGFTSIYDEDNSDDDNV